MKTRSARVLLTSVCRPFGGPGEGDSVGAELFHAQVTRAQGIFSFRQVIRCWAIDYIAENIEAPAVVLHYPSERELVREISKTRYDYVGINFVVATFHKVRRMVRLIREHAPSARIVLGGYGTVLPDELLAPYADHVCREEGCGFMRRLLGEDTSRPLSHPYAPIPAIRIYSFQQPTLVGHLTAGLGCPNGCDFCCTSHFFKRQYVPFIGSGRDIYEQIRAVQERADSEGHRLSSFILIDEDFFLYKKRALEFLESVREGGRPLSLMGFGSVRGLSQFSADEIAEMGFDTIWTAFEGADAGYGKLKGRPLENLYEELRARGVAVLSSMIIGFPYQDENRVRSEFDRLMALRPSLTQILIYFAFPGTPSHRQVLEEKRYLPQYASDPDLRRWDGFSMHFEHPHFQASELETLQRALYREDFERLGPSIVRILGVWLEGCRNLGRSQNPLLRARAEAKRATLRSSLPGLVPAILFGPNAERRAEARTLFREIRAELDGESLSERLLYAASPVLAAWTAVANRLRLFQQPALLRIEHRLEEGRGRKRPVVRLQGGFHANVLQVLREDMVQNAKDLWGRLRGKNTIEEGFHAGAVTRAD